MKKTKDKFYIEPYGGVDKTIRIEERGDYCISLGINIDFDDVDHEKIEKKVKKLVDLLNKHW